MGKFVRGLLCEGTFRSEDCGCKLKFKIWRRGLLDDSCSIFGMIMNTLDNTYVLGSWKVRRTKCTAKIGIILLWKNILLIFEMLKTRSEYFSKFSRLTHRVNIRAADKSWESGMGTSTFQHVCSVLCSVWLGRLVNK